MTRRQHRAAPAGIAALGVALLAGCAGAPRAGAGAGSAPTGASVDGGAGVRHASPVLATAAPHSSTGDATGRYTRAERGAAAGAATPGVDYADPVAVAHAYLSVRWTYRGGDPAAVVRALTAPALTTAAFAARSTPTPAQLAQLRTARQVESVRVRAAGRSAEAPNTATTAYVTVAFDRTDSYTGAARPQTRTLVWSLRLRRVPAPHPAQWRVDGVLQGD